MSIMNSKYQWIEQKLDYYGVACLEMILKRKGIKDIDQEQIAEFLVDARVLDINQINKFFEKYKLRLKAEFYPISKLGTQTSYYADKTADIRSFLKNNIRDPNSTSHPVNDNDIIANFWVKEWETGHYALIDGIYEISVSFCDPDTRRKNTMAEYGALEIMMSNYYDQKERGFILISQL